MGHSSNVVPGAIDVPPETPKGARIFKDQDHRIGHVSQVHGMGVAALRGDPGGSLTPGRLRDRAPRIWFQPGDSGFGACMKGKMSGVSVLLGLTAPRPP